MRQAFVHEAVLLMDADGDVRAPGAAVTAALCGHWDHEPPCPLAPHHTSAERSGDGDGTGTGTGTEVRLRVLFAAESAAEADVRRRIEAALSQGRLDGPDGVTTRWRFRGAQPSPVRTSEVRHAEQLTQSI